MAKTEAGAANSGAALYNSANPWRNLGWWWLLLPVLVAGLYSPGVHNDYVIWDDDIYIRDNPNLRDVAGLQKIWTPNDPERKFYPLTYSLHWLEYQLWGANPSGYYVVNVALHALNAVLVFLLLRALGAGGGVALLAAALFAASPMQAASVAWLAARKTLLSTTLALLGFITYWRARKTGRTIWSLLAFMFFAAALLSKTAAITFLVGAILAEWLLLRRRLLDAISPLALLILAVGGCLIYIDSRFERTGGVTYAEPLSLRPLAAAAAFWFYTIKALWPVDLALIYPKWTPSLSPMWFLPLAGLVAAGGAVWGLRRRIGTLAVWCAAYFFVTLLPILGLLSFGYLSHSPVGDQYLYPAAPGLFLFAALALERAAGWIGQAPARRVLLAVGLAATGGMGWLTWERIPQWRDPRSFWSSAVAGAPDFTFGRRRLATLYWKTDELEAALQQYELLLREDPDNAQMNNNIGLVLKSLGRPTEALDHFRVAVTAPDAVELPETQANLAILLKDTGALDAEISRLTQALARDPTDIEVRFALGVALAVNGQRRPAAQQAQQLVVANPNDAHLLYRVAFLLRANGQTTAAFQTYELAAKRARAQGLAKLEYDISCKMAALAASSAPQ